MTMKMFLLVTSSALLIGEVYCLDDYSSPKLPPSTIVIHNTTTSYWKDIHNKILHDFQSYFKSDKYQQNRMQPCKVKVEVSGQPDTFKLHFQRDSITHTCNFSVPLHLGHNGLENLSPDVFDKLRKFARLLLEDNDLDSLNVTISQNSDSLETLKIDINNLFALSRQIFHDLKDLKKLTLNKNNFSAIPQDLFHHNKKLKTIELTNNKGNLTKLPPKLFSDMVDLKVLVLRDNGLERLPEDLFWGSYNLKEIDLSSNGLLYLPKNLLRDAHELRIFNVSFNDIKWSPGDGMFVATNNLNQLDLSNNHIVIISSGLFVGLHKLQILNMENNIIGPIDRDAFISLPNLKIANFSGNKYIRLHTGLYDLLGNEISPFRHCHLLEELYLSGGMWIDKIYSDWIYNHTKLRILDLSKSALYSLNANNLQFNSSNLYVDLSHNNIHFVLLDKIGSIPKKANSSRNVVINLNWNPIYCSCDIYSLVRYVMNETSEWIKPEDLNYVKLITDNLYCGPPYKLGKSINQLSAEVLTCGVYEESDRLGSCYCPFRSCSCQIIPKYSMLKVNCANQSWFSLPDSNDAWHIDFAYVDLSNTTVREYGMSHSIFSDSVHRITDIVKGRYDSARELYLDISGNQIDHIEEHWLTENLRGLVLDGNNLTETDMEIVMLEAPKAVTEGIREKSWPCDPAIKEYQEYAINRFKSKEPIDWDMKKLMCPVKTRYFIDA